MNLSTTFPYDVRFKEAVDAILPDLSRDLSRATTLDEASADRLLSLILGLACQAQNVRNITLGREACLELPRQWLLNRIEKAAFQFLDWKTDDWEFRRLMEVAALLDHGLVSRLAQNGLSSSNTEVVKAAREYI